MLSLPFAPATFEALLRWDTTVLGPRLPIIDGALERNRWDYSDVVLCALQTGYNPVLIAHAVSSLIVQKRRVCRTTRRLCRLSSGCPLMSDLKKPFTTLGGDPYGVRK